MAPPAPPPPPELAGPLHPPHDRPPRAPRPPSLIYLRHPTTGGVFASWGSLAHVTFASGAVASVVNSVLSPREESYLRFDFERATVEVTHLYGYTDEDWRITPTPGCEEEVPAAWKRGSRGAPGVKSGHAAQFAHVLAALRDGRRPPVGPAAARGECLQPRG